MTILRRTSLLAAAAVVALATSGSTLPTDAAADARDDAAYRWSLTPTGSSARLRGLSAVSASVAWASGTEGTVLRTTDGGATWASVGPPGTALLQFRDIEATSSRHAVALSIGTGEDSRVYVTDNGGQSWTESFRNTEPTAFYDCMAFFDDRHGLAMSDPVDGKFRFIRTRDGGHSWTYVDPAGIPPALEGEFAFAASGTCLTTGPRLRAYVATGGVNPGRVMSTTNGGRTWTVQDTPVAGGPAAGIFSVRFRDLKRGVIVGGDFLVPDGNVAAAAWSRDGGKTWHLPTGRVPGGYRSGSAWVKGQERTVIAVGPTGSDVSRNAGRSWSQFDAGSFDSVECTWAGACWASGEQGRVAKLVSRDPDPAAMLGG